MTNAQLRTYKKGESRFYVDDATGATAPGVTSILNMLPKPFLQYWAAKVVAEEAVADLGSIVGMALRNPDNAVDYLKGAPRRVTKGAADFGTSAHDIFERLARGETMPRVHPEMREVADHFREFLDRVQPEFLHLEETFWSDTHNFAGSADAVAKIDGGIVILDWKTTRSGVHEEVALQLSAYGNADRIVLSETGESVPVPAIEAGAVLHVRPEGWKLVPTLYTPEVFGVFLHLRAIFDWDKELKRTVIGRPVATGGQQSTGSERRR